MRGATSTACAGGCWRRVGRPRSIPAICRRIPAALLAPARKGASAWLDADYEVMTFAPARLKLKPGEGPPHIRLDRAAEFLIGDRL